MRLKGEKLEDMKELMYLGSNISVNGRMEVGGSNRLSDWARVLGNLEYLRRIRGTFIDAKVGTLKWKAEPKLLYCSESWALNSEEYRKS